MESEILGHAFMSSLSGDADQDNFGKRGKVMRQAIDAAGEIVKAD